MNSAGNGFSIPGICEQTMVVGSGGFRNDGAFGPLSRFSSVIC